MPEGSSVCPSRTAALHGRGPARRNCYIISESYQKMFDDRFCILPRPERADPDERQRRSILHTDHTGHPVPARRARSRIPILPGRFSGDSRLSRDSSRFPSGSAPDSDADRAVDRTARLFGHRIAIGGGEQETGLSGFAFHREGSQDHGPAQPAEPRAGARDEPRAAAAARFL